MIFSLILRRGLVFAALVFGMAAVAHFPLAILVRSRPIHDLTQYAFYLLPAALLGIGIYRRRTREVPTQRSAPAASLWALGTAGSAYTAASIFIYAEHSAYRHLSRRGAQPADESLLDFFIFFGAIAWAFLCAVSVIVVLVWFTRWLVKRPPRVWIS